VIFHISYLCVPTHI